VRKRGGEEGGVGIDYRNEMRLWAHRGARGIVRDTRGATVTEYAIILFLVAVVAASGFRLFGQKLQGGVGKAGSNLETQNDSRPSAPQGGAGGGASSSGATASAGAGGGGGAADTTAVYGGPRTATTPQEGTPFGKFAMIALGIIGAAAAFFAAMKGKHAR
jgi:Flp pilus assembly pilin Flp